MAEIKSAAEILATVKQIASQETASESSANSPESKPKPELVRTLPSERPYRSVCPHCFTSLNSVEAEREHMAWERSKERSVDRITVALRDCGVMEEHLGAQVSDFSPIVQRAARAFLEGSQVHGMRAMGTPGTGKTRIAVALCRETLTAGKSIAYVHARAFFRRLWATYREDASETEDQVIRRYSSVDLLVVDDLGHEGKVSDAVIGALHEVLSERHGNYRPTAVTTNLTLEEIAAKYDASIASRMEAWLAVVLTGEDRRAQ